MRKLYILILLTPFLIACNKEERLASERLTSARQYVETGNFSLAKKELDSIHILFPNQIEIRREAKNMSDSIVVLEAQRNINYIDSVRHGIEQAIDSLTKKFIFEHNKKYENHGRFTHKSLYRPGVAVTGLVATVNDVADIEIRSTLVGIELRHNKVTLRSKGVEQSASGTSYIVGNQDLSRKKLYIEVATIEGDDARKLLHFVSANAEDEIRVVLSGNLSSEYTMASTTREALADTYRLAILMSDLQSAEQQFSRARALIYRFGSNNSEK